MLNGLLSGWLSNTLLICGGRVMTLVRTFFLALLLIAEAELLMLVKTRRVFHVLLTL
jgi:hypothetical protein